jgi:hypothetical protein
MPELQLTWGYYAVLGFIGTAIAIVTWLFWSKGFINWGRRSISLIKPFRVEKERLLGYVTHREKRK